MFTLSQNQLYMKYTGQLEDKAQCNQKKMNLPPLLSQTHARVCLNILTVGFRHYM